MSESRIIDMKQINKGYMLGTERVPVLKNVDFGVEKGEWEGWRRNKVAQMVEVPERKKKMR